MTGIPELSSAEAQLAVREAEAAYEGAVARAGKLVTKGHRGVAEAGRRLSLTRRELEENAAAWRKANAVQPAAEPVNATATRAAAPGGSFESFASVVKESTGATVTCSGAGIRAVSAEERFEQTAVEAALAGVEIEAVVRRATRRAADHVERERLTAQALEVVQQHFREGDTEPERLAASVAALMQREKLGVRFPPMSEKVGRAR